MTTETDKARRRSLFRRYVASFVGLVVFVLAISGATEIVITYRDMKDTLLHAQSEKASAAAFRVEQFLAELERQVSSATRASAVTLEQRQADYELILDRTPAVASVAFLDGSGRELLRVARTGAVSGSRTDQSRSQAFQAASAGTIWLGPMTFGPGGPQMQIAMAHSGTGAGVTIADIELKFLSDIVNSIQASPGMFAYMTTAEGRLIAHTNSSLATRNADFSSLPQVRAAADAATGIGTGPDGDSDLYAVATVPQMNWRLFVEEPLSQALSPVYSLLARLGGLFVLSMVLCVGAGSLLARRMTVPIKAVQVGAARLAAGDFTSAIDVKTGDEVEALADEFNRMARRLHDSYAALEQKVADRTRDLAQSVRELKALEEVGRAVAASLDLQNVLATIVTHAVELAEAAGGAIYSFDLERQSFNLAEAHGLDPDFVAAIREVRIKRMDGPIGAVAEQGLPIQVPDIAAAKDFPLRAATLSAGFKSALIVPLTSPAGVIGALVVERRTRGRFPTATVALVQAFAYQSALAMHNARLFREVEENRNELALANEHKARFFANMNHELRTPLNAIIGYAELLQDGLYGELSVRAKEVLDRVQANSHHLLGLINDVLDLSKLEAGELALQLDNYAMRTVVDTVVGATGSLAQTKGLSLVAEVEPELPLGRGDERRLTQVLLNLVSNAIKFTDQGGVTIRARLNGDRFDLSVADTGPGIAARDQARIFEAFQQVDNTITKNKGGTGLGLSISKRFVDMHGGTIGIESAPGAGSTFRILLPIRVDQQRRAA